jgi:hypothetical protein
MPKWSGGRADRSALPVRLQTVGGVRWQVRSVERYNVFVANPPYFRADLERYRNATRRASRSCGPLLRSTHDVVLSVVPHDHPALRSCGFRS